MAKKLYTLVILLVIFSCLSACKTQKLSGIEMTLLHSEYSPDEPVVYPGANATPELGKDFFVVDEG